MNKDIIIKGEPQEVTEIRKKIIDSFGDLVFIEDGHKYYLEGREIPSVTNVVKQFESEEDWDKIAERYAMKNGETPEYWKDKWKYNNLKATTTGTLVHEFGESISWMRNGHPELITTSCKSKYIEDMGWLIPTRKKEEAIVKLWDDMPECYHFVLAETKVYSNKNPQFQTKQQYCGTFDWNMYFKHPTDDSKSGLIIFDYKTNRDIVNEFARSNGKMLKYPFSDMYEEPLSIYTLQLSAYQIPLEDIGLKVIARKLIWLKDDGTYEKIDLEDKTKELREVL